MGEVLPSVSYVVPGYIAEGLTLIGGKAKIGKSWLLLGTAIAVATGGCALGSIDVEEGDVLYLALEDNKRRLQRRLNQLLPTGERPRRLYYALAWPRLDMGGLEEIAAWIESVTRPRLIIVDVLNRVRPAQKATESIYDYDVRSLSGLQSLAAEQALAIVVVHHIRKAEAEDPFDCLSGSTGLTGTADTTLVLSRDSQGTTFYGRGRDIEEVEAALSFDRTTGLWSILGPAAEVRRSDERGAILDVLKKALAPLTPAAIAEATGAKRENIKKLLHAMARAGEAVSLGPRRGYIHPDRVDAHTPSYHGYRVTSDGERHDD